jgi:2-amino-4-hydroxy-6-hydroxymethyldihydropteridine diphosphokinase
VAAVAAAVAVVATGMAAGRPEVRSLDAMTPTLRPAYVAIGSNLEEPPAQVRRAMEQLSRHEGVRLELRSRLYRSSPMGPQDQPDFVNAAVGVLTSLAPRELLEALLSIEKAMGRDRRERWGPRIIDLDLIWMVGDPVDEPGLKLPHPGVSERNFVLYPLADIAPSLRIPGHGRVAELAGRIGDAGLSVLEDLRGSS